MNERRQIAAWLLEGLTPEAIQIRAQQAGFGCFATTEAAAIQQLHQVLHGAQLHHHRLQTLGEIARAFDFLAKQAPAAGVAFYTLNDEGALAAATAEIVQWLCGRGLLTPSTRVLDIGCGIGRIAAAIQPHVALVIGTEISAAMAREARGRAPTLPVILAAGDALPFIASRSVDLILAVDSFPYLVLARVAEAHMHEAGRILRPGGALAILNLGYASPPPPFAAWCEAAGLAPILEAEQPFIQWDGRAYIAITRAGVDATARGPRRVP